VNTLDKGTKVKKRILRKPAARGKLAARSTAH
jgi:hypothetical protein